jgi:hypothetical protein
MVHIRLETERYLPHRHSVAVRTSIDNWAAALPARFDGATWNVDLDGPEYTQRFSLRFVLNEEPQIGELVVELADGKTQMFRDADVSPGRPEPPGPIVERGQVQRRYFPSDPPKWRPDVIVIGSGMGGGTVAERLSDLRLKVLILEAGGLVFPTHVANLPRRQVLGAFDKHLWQIWPDFRAAPFKSNTFVGGPGFNLGGRSVFWGGFIPRMTSWELDFWPKRVKWDLEDIYYDKAEALVGKSTGPATVYRQYVYAMLADLLRDYSHKDAPMAVRIRPEGSNWMAGGLFSTADLLLESLLTPGAFGKDNLHVLLNHDVTKLGLGPKTVTVHARDLLNGRDLVFDAPVAILAAGTIESAKIAVRSQLPNESRLLGKGVTDHPVYFTHFKIPASSKYYDPFGNVKTLSQPKEGGGKALDRDPFNILVELGADFNQGRYLDEEILKEHLRRRDFSMLCEIVFLFNQELDDRNAIEFPHQPGPETIHMRAPSLPRPLMDRLFDIRNRLLAELGAEILKRPSGGNSEGFGGVGGVAHEVGSLRMRVQDGGRIESGLRQPSSGVVDEDGKWLEYDRLYVCDLSMFPTSPAANPSLTLIALALRVADRIHDGTL